MSDDFAAHFAPYLAALAAKLDGTPADNVRALDEIAAHLHDVAAAELAAGHDAATAATCALERIGAVDALAARFAHEADGRWPSRLSLRLLRALAAGLFALGLGSVVTRPAAALLGRDFFLRDMIPMAVTPAQCFALMDRYRLGDCAAALLEDQLGRRLWLGLALAVAAAFAWWALGALLDHVEPLRGRARLDRYSAFVTFALAYAGALYLVFPGTGALDFVAGIVVDVAAIGYLVRSRRVRLTS